jgi:hypothetical protein
MESMLRQPERQWSLPDWRSRYLDQPALSRLARRLIWMFTGDGVSAPSTNEANSAISVRLWHPAGETADSVRAWRAFLEARQITQPFKQAHREVYLLTDAERRTETYSNRFAGHVLRQHQVNALCAARGWSYKLQGGWDGGGGVPTLDLPAAHLRAEFWIEPVIGDDAPASHAGVALHLTTDQVRFSGGKPYGQLRLDAIHPQVFSEVMRDVDLFVGVCSVGNDPTWSDGGPNGHFRDYWNIFSFGDLSATAETRKEILATLVPRLAIARQCSLTGRFLRVQGSLRAYKIHLGSGNVLMEPNDQYLCIVPDRSQKKAFAPNFYLPFEGDHLVGIILSKAFLLARDEKITDPSITRQILPA